MSKDEFGHVAFMFLVHVNGNTLAVVEESDLVGSRVNGNVEFVHGRITLLVVGSIDEDWGRSKHEA